MKNFESLELFAPLNRALAEQNYTQPTPIQAQTIPRAIEGQDILGCAQTGTGKTAAFALPILDYLGYEDPPIQPNKPLVLVLAPTRELAIQISESFGVYGKYMKLKQTVVYGGVSQRDQVRALRSGVHVLIATPGRLLDLMEQGHVDLRAIEILVLDEADRMLDLGFMPALKKIIALLPSERQSLFFSATMPPKIRELSERLLFNPATVNVTPESPSVERIEQRVQYVDRGSKIGSLCDLIEDAENPHCIVFTRTKHGANGLVRKLENQGIRSVAIHGNKSQGARQQALEAFRQRKISVLVATDIAARGIDIDGVTHVINYDMPVDPESYVHRIGRTGRAGAEGVAISFCTADEQSELRAIEKLIDQRLTVSNPEFELGAPSPAAPRQQRSRRLGRSGQRQAGHGSRGGSRNGSSRRAPSAGQRRRGGSKSARGPAKHAHASTASA